MKQNKIDPRRGTPRFGLKGPGGFGILVGLAVALGLTATAQSIPVGNASFEAPLIDPLTNPFGAVPVADIWDETGPGTEAEEDQNTGVFRNTDPGSPDRISNADGLQLAFMSSEEGNSFRQEVAETFQFGQCYELTVGVGVSATFPAPPNSLFVLAFYRVVNDEPVIIAARARNANGLSATMLEDFNFTFSADDALAPYLGEPIGILISAGGPAGGFFNIDNVRLEQRTLVLDDCDGSGAIDGPDADQFLLCLNGPDNALLSGCICSDRSGDSDVDLADLALIQAAFDPNGGC